MTAEVNAIETAYLQADLLADHIKRTDIKRYLLKYVDIRLSGVKTGALYNLLKEIASTP
jgi:hypothetical protein